MKITENNFGSGVGILEARVVADGVVIPVAEISANPETGEHWEVDFADFFVTGVGLSGNGATMGIYVTQKGAAPPVNIEGTDTRNNGMHAPVLSSLAGSGGVGTEIYQSYGRFTVSGGQSVRGIYFDGAGIAPAGTVVIVKIAVRRVKDC